MFHVTLHKVAPLVNVFVSTLQYESPRGYGTVQCQTLLIWLLHVTEAKDVEVGKVLLVAQLLLQQWYLLLHVTQRFQSQVGHSLDPLLLRYEIGLSQFQFPEQDQQVNLWSRRQPKRFVHHSASSHTNKSKYMDV